MPPDPSSRLLTGREQEMSSSPRWQEISRHCQIIRIVEDQEPSVMGAQPALDSRNGLLLILLMLWWQMEQTRQFYIA